MEIWVINGPNLNLLGSREPEKYGHTTLAQLESELQSAFPEIQFRFLQSTTRARAHRVQQAAQAKNIINPGGFAHSSVALSDALTACATYKVREFTLPYFFLERFRRASITALGVNASIARSRHLGLSFGRAWPCMPVGCGHHSEWRLT